MAEFTGERLVPGQVEPDLYNEHVSRYYFAASLLRGRSILDAGCGMGYGSACLASEGGLVVGIDQDVAAVQSAAHEYRHPNLHFVPGLVQQLPFADQSFDCAVSFEVIEHLKEPQHLLASLKQVIRPTGVVVLSTPNRDVYRLSRGEAGPNPFHHYEFSLAEFTQLLKQFFPYVRMFAQNHAPAITFRQVGASDPGLVLRPPEDREEDLSNAQFFVAVCSAAPLPELSDAVFMAKGGNVLFERESHIRLLKDELELKSSWLTSAQSSLEALHQAHKKLQGEHDERSAWALQTVAQLEDTNRKLAQQLGAKCDELQETVNRLNEAEQTIVERTEWARSRETGLHEANEQISRLQQQLDRLGGTLSALEGPHRQLLVELAALKADFIAVVSDLAKQAGFPVASSPLSTPKSGKGDGKDLDKDLAEARALAGKLEEQVKRQRHHSIEHQLARDSRWVRIGRALGVGPKLTDGQDPS
jgi:SAM-dependent methyltransferase